MWIFVYISHFLVSYIFCCWFFFLQSVIARKFPCILERSSFNYQCKFSNIVYVNESESFEIEGDHLAAYDESKVAYVHFVNSIVHFMPMEILTTFTNLVQLYVDQTQLEIIDKPIINCKNMIVLSFRWCNIKHVPKLFDNCIQLTHLYLSHTEILTFEAAVFKELVHLQVEDLQDNKYDELPKNIFETNVNIQEFYLGNGQLQKIYTDDFKHLKYLSNLYLQGNSIIEFKDAIEDLNNLEDLYLAANNIHEIKATDFRGKKS